MNNYSEKNLTSIEEAVNLLPKYNNRDILVLNKNKIKDVDLSIIPDSIKHIYLDDNNIKTINFSDRSWGTLSFANNGLSIEIIDNLTCTELNLTDNKIKEITLIRCNIKNLSLSNCGLFQINFFECNIENLNLSCNFMTGISHFPNGILHIDYSDNKIKEIESLPDSLITINLSDNMIKILPNYPTNLYKLDLSQNQIEFLSVDNLPQTLDFLDITDNPIENPDKILKPFVKQISQLYYDIEGEDSDVSVKVIDKKKIIVGNSESGSESESESESETERMFGRHDGDSDKMYNDFETYMIEEELKRLEQIENTIGINSNKESDPYSEPDHEPDHEPNSITSSISGFRDLYSSNPANSSDSIDDITRAIKNFNMSKNKTGSLEKMFSNRQINSFDPKTSDWTDLIVESSGVETDGIKTVKVIDPVCIPNSDNSEQVDYDKLDVQTKRMLMYKAASERASLDKNSKKINKPNGITIDTSGVEKKTIETSFDVDKLIREITNGVGRSNQENSVGKVRVHKLKPKVSEMIPVKLYFNIYR